MNELSKRLYCKWWLADWLSCETRYSMTAAQRGVYRDALDLCYAEGSIPADEQTLMRLLAVTPEEFTAAWPTVSKKFGQHPDLPHRLINPRAAREIAEEEDFRRRQAEHGSKGGRPKAKEKGSLSAPFDFPKGQEKGSLSAPFDFPKGQEKGSLSAPFDFPKGQESQHSTAQHSKAKAAAAGNAASKRSSRVAAAAAGSPRTWERTFRTLRDKRLFPTLTDKVTQRISARLADVPPNVTDTALASWIKRHGAELKEHLLREKGKRPDPITFVLWAVDGVSEETAREQDAAAECDRAWREFKQTAGVLLDKVPVCPCGSLVRWERKPGEWVCGACCEPIDEDLRMRVTQAVAAQAAGQTAHQILAERRAQPEEVIP